MLRDGKKEKVSLCPPCLCGEKNILENTSQ
jgi:hypothetical protein